MPFIRPTASAGLSYSTNFPLTENPLSEGGRWVSPASAVWNTTVRSAGGKALGDPASVSANDCVSFLVGPYLPRQIVTCVVFLGGATGGGEWEIHLRGSFNGTQIFSYEIDFVQASHFCAIVKWLGNQNSFSQVASGACTLADDDVIIADIAGSASSSTITVKQNGATIVSFTDTSSPYVLGNPGIGFDDGDVNAANFGWKSFSAVTTP